jgi:hypothetical protein
VPVEDLRIWIGSFFLPFFFLSFFSFFGFFGFF